MKDIYQREIEILTENPDRIYDHWNLTSPLFQAACSKTNEGSYGFGCLTQIRTNSDRYSADTPELTKLIELDERLPLSPLSNAKYNPSENTIKIEHLEVFAEWQRRLDKELGRVTPDDFDFNAFYVRHGLGYRV